MFTKSLCVYTPDDFSWNLKVHLLIEFCYSAKSFTAILEVDDWVRINVVLVVLEFGD